MPTNRFPTLLVLPATLWLAVSLGDEDCSITRPGGVKEPGVTNTRGECCSSFYSNSGNADDCVPPTPGRADGAKFYTSVSNTDRSRCRIAILCRCGGRLAGSERQGARAGMDRLTPVGERFAQR